jgi:putative addiction module component (TIGR02574 family)
MSKPSIDFSSLTVEQRLDLIGQIWDSLEALPPLTPEQEAELDRRSREVDADPDAGADAAEVIARLRARLK